MEGMVLGAGFAGRSLGEGLVLCILKSEILHSGIIFIIEPISVIIFSRPLGFLYLKNLFGRALLNSDL